VHSVTLEIRSVNMGTDRWALACLFYHVACADCWR